MKILLVEDDPSMGQLLETMMTAYRYTVDIATDGYVGLELATQGEYGIILLDVIIPRIDGLSLCRKLRSQGCQTPILIITAKDSGDDVIAGLDAGADDYVTKPFDILQLVARIRALLRRQEKTALSPVLQWGSLCFDPTLIKVTYREEVVILSPKEYCLLELFLRHPQRIFSRSTIIDRIWSIDDSPTDAAVTNLIKDLRRKLKAAGMEEELIETVYRLGYRLKAAPTEGSKEKEKKTDSLTEVANQIYFDEVIQQEWERLSCDRAPLSLILCNIDYLKSYNDCYGYQAGNACLQKVARAIQNCTNSSTHLVVRYRGDEFAIVLPNTRLEAALEIAARIQQAIANLQIPHQLSPTSDYVTLSLGITGTVPTENKSPKDLIQVAAQALCTAKARGHNTYCLYSF